MSRTWWRAGAALWIVGAALALGACQSDGASKAGQNEPVSQAPGEASAQGEAPGASEAPTSQPASAQKGQPRAEPPPEGFTVATFAGGCFWCMEPPFEKLDGVREVLSGYTGGEEQHPTYKQVSSGQTGHTEAVRVTYDPEQVSYGRLLEVYWRSMDPTDGGGQFADRGSQYRPAIFVHDAAQRQAAEASKEALAESGRFDEPIVVPIQDAQTFWVAETYHQDYYEKNPIRYKSYARGSGRVGFLERTWAE